MKRIPRLIGPSAIFGWSILLAFLGSAAADGGPRVVVSIGPLHSLVAGVMGEIATPALLIPPGASPHSYAMRPSDARNLSSAQLVLWIGAGLETFLVGSLRTLAGGARIVALIDSPGIVRLATRTGDIWEEGGHGHAESGDGRKDDHDHEVADYDPHLWLDPENARIWVAQIADELGLIDPAHSEVYRHNADILDARLAALIAELDESLAPVRAVPYVVFHDAYQYFEARFHMNAVGAVTLSPARATGANILVPNSGKRMLRFRLYRRCDRPRLFDDSSGSSL